MQRLNDRITQSALMALPTLTVAFLLLGTEARANGWEHAAIPFDDLVIALNFDHPETRRRAAESFGFRGSLRALPPLRQRLQLPEPNPYVRGAIYVALGRLGDKADATRVAACLEKESIDEIRATCATALGRLGAKQSSAVLLELASDEDKSEALSAAAILALASYPESEVIETLARLASAGGVRALAALAALGSTGDKRAVPHLLAVLEKTQDRKQRGAAVVALGMIGDSAAAPALLRIVETERDEGMRIRAVAALAAIESGSPVRALIELLDDPSPQIQLYAIRGLRRSGAEEAGPPLAAYAEKISVRLGQDVKSGWKRPAYGVLQDLSLVEASLRAIAGLDPESGTRALLKTAALGQPPSGRPDSLKVAEGVYRARRGALYGLGYTGSVDALALLLGEWGLGDADPRLRAVAVRSLGVLGGPEAVSALEFALLDPVPEVRWTAARVLGLMKANDAATQLVDTLEDGNRQVRIEASTALGIVGDEQATDKLMRVAEEDPEESVRIAARLALERLDEF